MIVFWKVLMAIFTGNSCWRKIVNLKVRERRFTLFVAGDVVEEVTVQHGDVAVTRGMHHQLLLDKCIHDSESLPPRVDTLHILHEPGDSLHCNEAALSETSLWTQEVNTIPIEGRIKTIM